MKCCFALSYLLLGTILYAQPGLKLSPEQKKVIAIIHAAQGQPIEVEAYVLRKLRDHGIAIPASLSADVLRDLRDRAGTSAHWLFRSPASLNIGTGYAGLAGGMLFRSSGLEILLDSLEWGTAVTPSRARVLLENLPRPRPLSPTCDTPIVESWRPLYLYLAAHAESLYPSADDRLALMRREAAQVTSVFDIGDFVEFARKSISPDFQDQRVLAGELAGILNRIDPPPCGMQVLLSKYPLGPSIEAVQDQLRSGGVTDLSLVAAYRRFVVRMSGAPVCKRDSLADSAELRARDKMVQAFNEHARKFAGSVPPISADEIRGAAQDRKLLDAQEPTFPYPPELWSAYLAFRPYIQDPSLASAKPSELQDTVQAFLHEWERRNWSLIFPATCLKKNSRRFG